jgi:tocopherol O-methyltransferase
MTALRTHPSFEELKTRIQRHYDIAAPLYRTFWGLHVHHGYWLDGTETKEAAQEQLVRVLATSAGIRNGSRILDIGCGFGASARFLAQHFHAKVTGINISEKQVNVAKSITMACDPRPDFVISDAEYPGIAGEFDVLWSIEAISHFPKKRDCFGRLLELLVQNGRVAIIDWFKFDGLNRREKRYIDPIVQQMLLPDLSTMRFYTETLQDLGCRIVCVQDISAYVTRTWDICLQLTQIPFIWKFALSHGSDFISFLNGFRAMKEGFSSGAFQCGMLIVEKSDA